MPAQVDPYLSAASRLIDAGLDPVTVAGVLGHDDPSIRPPLVGVGGAAILWRAEGLCVRLQPTPQGRRSEARARGGRLVESGPPSNGKGGEDGGWSPGGSA